MPAENHITVRQLNAMLLVFLIANFNVFLPQTVAREAGRDAWISLVLATIIALAVTFLLLKLALHFPDSSVMKYSVSLFGAQIGQITGTIYLLMLILSTSRPVFKAGIIGQAAFQWPNRIVIGTMLISVLIAGYLVRRGLHAIAKISEYGVLVGVALVLVIGFTSISKVNWTNFTPVLANGWLPVLKGTATMLQHFALAYVLLLLLPKTKQAGDTIKLSMLSILLVAFLMCIGIFSIGIHGAAHTAATFIPSLQLIHDSVFGRNVWLTALAVAIWIAGQVVNAAIGYWLFIAAIAETTGTNRVKFRRLILPAGAAILIIGLVFWNNIPETRIFLTQYFKYLSYATWAVIPIALLIPVAFFQRGRRLQPE
ncbi:GerAB/ArcD/ProY family transporter [Desulfotomaculum copahuensis]|uniref:Uncharacterized protein n=1 Tax=Desulfotomaculum copahuensis TaxID=1838280 RepID=A0A1B7LD96_9FIRM|nr:GerAB/ArcD/ProY family transporter [Desulfotomaculum copahuensis]OAT80859.1 hypothetical protein A6M21_12380 [Desulfotomaculum copahuensis]